MGSKRKRNFSSIESVDGSKEIAWLDKQIVPSGSSPVAWDPQYLSSSDEEYEGFMEMDHLLLSDVPSSISNTDVLKFFKGFKCKLVARDNKHRTCSIKFSSPKLAAEALVKFKDAKLRNRDVCLTRCVDSRYKSFCISGFSKKLSRAGRSEQVRDDFSNFGEIIHFSFPPDEEKFGYLFIALNPSSQRMPN